MVDLNELAARIEQASGPDRELDAAIGCAVAGYYLAEPRYPGAKRMYGYVDGEGSRVEPGNGSADSLIPRYTASLDAAMTLLDGVGVLMHLSDIGADGLPLARVGNPETAEVFNGIASCIMTDTAPAAGLALALCAAALKARARAMEAGRG